MGKRNKKLKRKEKYIKKEKEEELKKIQQKEKKEKESKKLKEEKIDKNKDKDIKNLDNKIHPKTILDYIKDENGISLPSKEEDIYLSTKKNNSSNSSKITNKEIKEIKNQINTSNLINQQDYLKSIKPKIVMINGKMTIEKPDISLFNKQYIEQFNKNSIQIQQLDEVKKITSLSFKKLNHTKKWSEDDTKLFYKGLEIFGLDFSFLEIILKPRTRIEIKKKFHKEIKIHKNEIEKCLNSEKSIGKMIEILNNYKQEIKEKEDLKGKNLNENCKEKIKKINEDKGQIYKKIINNNKNTFNEKNIKKHINKLLNDNNNEYEDLKENIKINNNIIKEKEEEVEKEEKEEKKINEENNKKYIDKKRLRNIKNKKNEEESDEDSNRTLSEGKKEEAKRNAFINNILKNF